MHAGRMASTPAGWHLRADSPHRDSQLAGAELLPPLEAGRDYLCVVAADIATETKVEFPCMAGLYWAEPDAVNPADFVRCSMSIPGFFKPVTVPLKIRDAAHLQLWRELAGMGDDDLAPARFPPPFACFVDGGRVIACPEGTHEPLQLLDAKTLKPRFTIYHPEWRFRRIVSAAESPTLVALQGRGSNPREKLSVWDVKTGKEVKQIDLTVDRLHNFVADDVVVHNSIEQDADLVMFVYRDDYYDKESEREGIADLIIAKHRNGGLGTVELTFQKDFPRFMSYAGDERY